MPADRKKIGLIGTGNMGGAIFQGLLGRGIAAPADLLIFDRIPEKMQVFEAKWKVKAAPDLGSLASACDILLLAVKPQDLEAAAPEIKGGLKPGKTVISVLAGISRAKLAGVLGTGPSYVRAMPNLGALEGESMTALCGNDPAALAEAEKIFNACGKSVRLEESFFDLVTAVSGSGPAYFFLLMELLEEKGVEKGLSRETARVLALQTAAGAAAVAGKSPDSPGELRRKVTSKGGTTEAALKVLEAAGFRESFSKALDAAERRGRELRGES